MSKRPRFCFTILGLVYIHTVYCICPTQNYPFKHSTHIHRQNRFCYIDMVDSSTAVMVSVGLSFPEPNVTALLVSWSFVATQSTNINLRVVVFLQVIVVSRIFQTAFLRRSDTCVATSCHPFQGV